MNPTLTNLLSSYTSLLKGEEADMEHDPIYSSLFPSGPQVSQAEGRPSDAAGPLPTNSIQAMVREMARRKYGWGDKQWSSLTELIANESGWNPAADNPTSSAYGLFQFLDSTWGSGYGGITSPTSNPRKQARAGLSYIASRYGNPVKALNFWESNSPHYY